MIDIKIAIYPGSFNPIHEGHIDIIKRASKLFNELYVLVANNPNKKEESTLLSRYQNVSKKVSSLKLTNVKVAYNDKLTVDFAKKYKCKYIVRAIRNIKDYKYELNMAKINKMLANSIETIIFIANKELKNVSSTKIKKLMRQIGE